MVAILCQQRHQQSIKITHWVEQVPNKVAIVKRPPYFKPLSCLLCFCYHPPLAIIFISISSPLFTGVVSSLG